MCKHYDSDKGCQSGDKCMYAHGIHELRKPEDVINIYNLASSW